MLVNQIAMKAGVPAHVVRYYTRIGLLTPGRDRQNGYKHYSDKDFERIQFIRQAKSVGLTLEEVRGVLTHVEQGTSPCSMVRKTLEDRIQETELEISNLLAKKERMEKTLRGWKEIPDQPATEDTPCHLIRLVSD